jgi:hypothetical protein
MTLSAFPAHREDVGNACWTSPKAVLTCDFCLDDKNAGVLNVRDVPSSLWVPHVAPELRFRP